MNNDPRSFRVEGIEFNYVPDTIILLERSVEMTTKNDEPKLVEVETVCSNCNGTGEVVVSLDSAPNHKNKCIFCIGGKNKVKIDPAKLEELGYIPIADAPKYCEIDGRRLDDIFVWYVVDKELCSNSSKRQLYADIIKTNPITLKKMEK